MGKVVTIHSFRRAAGRSSLTANLSALLAQKGQRVAALDTDFQYPSLYLFFNLPSEQITHTFNDYLWGKCSIQDATYDVTTQLSAPVSGKVFLTSSSVKVGDTIRILREGYDVGSLNEGVQDLIEELHLDYLLIDTPPGISEETFQSIAVSDVLVSIMRPDQQDFQGSSVTVEVARKLDVPNIFLVVNYAAETLDFQKLQQDVKKLYGCEEAIILPYSDAFMLFGSAGIFSLQRPDHPVTALYRQLVDKLISL